MIIAVNTLENKEFDFESKSTYIICIHITYIHISNFNGNYMSCQKKIEFLSSYKIYMYTMWDLDL